VSSGIFTGTLSDEDVEIGQGVEHGSLRLSTLSNGWGAPIGLLAGGYGEG